jgi:hypothetical protein
LVAVESACTAASELHVGEGEGGAAAQANAMLGTVTNDAPADPRHAVAEENEARAQGGREA